MIITTRFFFRNSKILNGISFSDLNYFNALRDDYDLENNLKENKSSQVGIIEFSINRSNYDSYQRTYQRLQSLLAEIMSVISLLFDIGNQIANIFCEKESHKKIIIGRDGNMLKKIGIQARLESENLLGSKLNLKLWVKVKKNWRNNDFYLKQFGYDDKKS